MPSYPKTIIVTGSTRGIGYGIAASLLERGCNVVLSGPRQANCDSAAASLRELASSKGEVLPVSCDVTSERDVENLWQAGVEAFGQVDIWLNNAGLALTGKQLADLPSEEFATMLNVNLLGAMHGCKVAFNGMRDRGGAIYNMLGAGWDAKPVPGMIGYASSKAGLTFMHRSFAMEAEGSNVRVNAFAPGVVMSDGFMREQARSKGGLSPERRSVLNIIGDHVETIADWVAETMLNHQGHAELFNWLTPERIAERQAMTPPRDVLSRYELA